MKKAAFLGGGKIGKAMVAHLIEKKNAEVVFIYDPFLADEEYMGVKIVKELSEADFEGLDLVMECANAEVVQEYAPLAIRHCDFLPFSMTAFRDDALLNTVTEEAERSGHTLYFPHGAILGLDGIFDGRAVLKEVSIETTKNPKSLGREDTERTVVFEGSAREAAGLYPRNVNVHAVVSLAGIGFDKTRSVIISDPAVTTNAHVIRIKGDGIDFEIHVTAYAAGAVSGKYVPHSACGSLDRVLSGAATRFV